ncbi:oxidoreductase [Paraphysoderma sedebokerense]|nr:oxidoreductase [Paraphysoderma sedebokerense]
MSVAIVTGGGRGLGSALVSTLLQKTSLNVIATARSPDTATTHLNSYLRTQKVSPQSIQSRLTVLPLDLSSPGSIVDVSKEIRKRYGEGSVKLLVNNSGMLEPEKTVKGLSYDRFLETVKVNTIGPIMLVGELVRENLLNVKKGSGGGQGGAGGWKDDVAAVIANISARTGSIGDNRLGGWYSYRCSKAGLNQGTKTLGLELGRKGIVVVSLHPGTVKTEMSAPFQGNVPPGKLFEKEKSAGHLYDVILGLGEKDNGKFYDYAGKEVVW